MSIMDRIFGGQHPQQSQPAQQPNSAATATPGNLGFPAPGNAPMSDGKVNAFPPTATGPKSPLEEYAELFNAPKDGEPHPGIPDALPNFAIDPDKLAEIANGIDFTNGTTTEQLKAAFGEGINEEAVRSVLNTMHRNNLQQTYSSGVKTIGLAMTHHNKMLTDKTIPELMRRNAVPASNAELFTNPATKPMVDMLQERFANQYPQASPEQIRQHTDKYLTEFVRTGAASLGMGDIIKPNARQQKQIMDQDWSSFGDDAERQYYGGTSPTGFSN